MTVPAALIEPDVVTALLAGHVDQGLRCRRVTRSAVGNGQETWLVDAVDAAGADRRFVLRRSAPAGVLDDTDRRHEFETLRALQGRGLPTPRPHWLETEPSSLGRPFFIMDRLPGRPPAPRSEAEAAAVARDLGRRLAQLHRVPPVAGGPDSQASTSAEVARWKDRYHARRVAPVPMVGALLAWLEVNLPSDGAAPCLLWGDAGPHNVLVEEGRISAMLDWELSHVGHPMEDLGAAVWACLGRYPEEEVVAGYEDEAGQAVDRDVLAYFAVLGCVSRTVMQLAGVDSFVRAETNALNLAGLGLTLPLANLRRAAAYARWPAATEEPAADPPADDPMRLRPDVGELLDGVCRFLADDVLPETSSPHLKRGLKTAVGLLGAVTRRIGDEAWLRGASAARLDALFDTLQDAGVGATAGRRDAEALEEAAVRVETDPALAGLRHQVRRALLTEVLTRQASVEPLVRLYGPDVRPGRPFRR